MEKMAKEEAEMILESELQGSQAEALLLEEQELRSNIQVSGRCLAKLQSVTNEYEQAISDLLMTEKMDVNLKMAYTKKLTQQQKLTDLTLVQLQTAINFFNISNEGLESPPVCRQKFALSRERLEPRWTLS